MRFLAEKYDLDPDDLRPRYSGSDAPGDVDDYIDIEEIIDAELWKAQGPEEIGPET